MFNLMKVKLDCLTLRDEGTLFLQDVRNQTTHTMTGCHMPEDLNPHSAVITSNLEHNLKLAFKIQSQLYVHTITKFIHIEIVMISR